MTTTVVKDLATVGLGIGAPLLLMSGIGVGVTVFRGVPALLGFVFILAAGLTVVSTLAYLAADAIERAASASAPPPD